MKRASRKEKPTDHPGIILRRDYLVAYGISQTALALMLGVHPRRINEIVHGLRAVTADTAVRLEIALGTSAEYWMGLQASFARGVEAKVCWTTNYGLDPDGLPASQSGVAFFPESNELDEGR